MIACAKARSYPSFPNISFCHDFALNDFAIGRLNAGKIMGGKMMPEFFEFPNLQRPAP